MLDRKLIDGFRETVNEYCVFSKYINFNDQNQWNCICSAMDWITVSVDYLCKHPASVIPGFGSIEMYSFISCIDLIVEAIEQLHRVIFDTRKAVFQDDSDIFLGNDFKQNDRRYFKTIRSCFGAHPVNLDDPMDEHSKTKYYASWSGDFFGKKEYAVILSSNQVNGEDILLEIRFEQLLSFAEKYYNHLRELEKELVKQINHSKQN